MYPAKVVSVPRSHVRTADVFVANDVPPTVTGLVAARVYVLFRYKRSSYAPDTVGATRETVTGLLAGT